MKSESLEEEVWKRVALGSDIRTIILGRRRVHRKDNKLRRPVRPHTKEVESIKPKKRWCHLWNK